MQPKVHKSNKIADLSMTSKASVFTISMDDTKYAYHITDTAKSQRDALLKKMELRSKYFFYFLITSGFLAITTIGLLATAAFVGEHSHQLFVSTPVSYDIREWTARRNPLTHQTSLTYTQPVDVLLASSSNNAVAVQSVEVFAFHRTQRIGHGIYFFAMPGQTVKDKKETVRGFAEIYLTGLAADMCLFSESRILVDIDLLIVVHSDSGVKKFNQSIRSCCSTSHLCQDNSAPIRVL